MAKQTTSFRLPELTHERLAELCELFKESGAEIVERAVSYLYENREEVAKQDLESRLAKLKKAD
ncbi:hypothetical protein [uncultured Spirosoma sp.]|uniref:hypothetical protein n=1 Tax=uncultured Spirosoma sp. TaxID=278208 RepID=UPI00258A2060|nr:hypothetical protein [uncultured Spirosoma sp.]